MGLPAICQQIRHKTPPLGRCVISRCALQCIVLRVSLFDLPGLLGLCAGAFTWRLRLFAAGSLGHHVQHALTTLYMSLPDCILCVVICLGHKAKHASSWGVSCLRSKCLC